MTKPNPKIKKVLDSLEHEVRRSGEALKRNFTQLPQEMLAQVTGKEISVKNYDDIDMSHLESEAQTSDEAQMAAIREKLAKLQGGAGNSRFRQFKEEVSEGAKSLLEEKQAYAKRLEEAEEIKKQKQAQEEQGAPAPIPRGKVRRSIFSPKTREKTAENRAGFGKM